MSEEHSSAKKLSGYSFLVVFANDDTISEGEIKMIEKMVLKDGKVDEEEKEVLRRIFERANPEHMEASVKEEIEAFRKQYAV